MIDEKLEPCIVIYTIVLGRKNYIVDWKMPPDNTLLPLHAPDVNKAIGFKTDQEVKAFLVRVVNRQNREYLTEPSEQPAANFKPVKYKHFEESKLS